MRRYRMVRMAGGSRPVRMHPLKLLGMIFGGIGLLFAALGCVFLAVSAELLPQVFTPEVWLGDTPDELALPVIGVVFGAMGLVFLLVGGVMLLILRRQKRLREELEQYGTRVTGAVADIRVDRIYQVNGHSPLRVFVSVRHPFTNEELTLRSGPVWNTALTTGDPVEVLFDPMDEKKHLVLLEKTQAE